MMHCESIKGCVYITKSSFSDGFKRESCFGYYDRVTPRLFVRRERSTIGKCFKRPWLRFSQLKPGLNDIIMSFYSHWIKINPHLINALPDPAQTASRPQSHSNKSIWSLYGDVKNTWKDNQYVYLYKLDNRWVIGPHALAKDNRKCWAYSSVNDGRPTEAGFKLSFYLALSLSQKNSFVSAQLWYCSPFREGYSDRQVDFQNLKP